MITKQYKQSGEGSYKGLLFECKGTLFVDNLHCAVYKNGDV